ncbi:MAG TPA: hypothetical protein VF698_12865, partial [Thermoanaerobaculia bacterium]
GTVLLPGLPEAESGERAVANGVEVSDRRSVEIRPHRAGLILMVNEWNAMRLVFELADRFVFPRKSLCLHDSPHPELISRTPVRLH